VIDDDASLESERESSDESEEGMSSSTLSTGSQDVKSDKFISKDSFNTFDFKENSQSDIDNTNEIKSLSNHLPNPSDLHKDDTLVDISDDKESSREEQVTSNERHEFEQEKARFDRHVGDYMNRLIQMETEYSAFEVQRNAQIKERASMTSDRLILLDGTKSLYASRLKFEYEVKEARIKNAKECNEIVELNAKMLRVEMENLRMMDDYKTTDEEKCTTIEALHLQVRALETENATLILEAKDNRVASKIHKHNAVNVQKKLMIVIEEKDWIEKQTLVVDRKYEANRKEEARLERERDLNERIHRDDCQRLERQTLEMQVMKRELDDQKEEHKETVELAELQHVAREKEYTAKKLRYHQNSSNSIVGQSFVRSEIKSCRIIRKMARKASNKRYKSVSSQVPEIPLIKQFEIITDFDFDRDLEESQSTHEYEELVEVQPSITERLASCAVNTLLFGLSAFLAHVML